MLTQEQLKKEVEYNPLTGEFRRLRNGTRYKVGDIAGSPNSEGYICFRVLGKTYKAHRLAWLYIYGVLPSSTVDHINRQRDDNRISNLRDVSNRSNCSNRHDNNMLVGVNYKCSRGSYSYRAYYQYEGKHLSRSFSTAKYGDTEALALAIAQRKKWEQEYGI